MREGNMHGGHTCCPLTYLLPAYGCTCCPPELLSVASSPSHCPLLSGLFMDDDEGTLTTTDVKAKFINGKPQV